MSVSNEGYTACILKFKDPVRDPVDISAAWPRDGPSPSQKFCRQLPDYNELENRQKGLHDHPLLLMGHTWNDLRQYKVECPWDEPGANKVPMQRRLQYALDGLAALGGASRMVKKPEWHQDKFWTEYLTDLPTFAPAIWFK